MKAIRVHAFGGPEVLLLEEIPAHPPGPDEVLIEIKAAGVNPVDSYILTGNYAFKPDLPYVPGMDGAGRVKKVGNNVKTFRPEDRVYVSGNTLGTYTQELVCSPDFVFPLPDSLSFEQGAAIGVPYATAFRALFTKGKAVSEEVLLIHGASGGVGVAAVQLAKAAGMKIIATAGSSAGCTLVQDQGADYVFNHARPGYLSAILSLLQGKGINLIIEMLANVNLSEDLKLLAPYGRVVVVGSRGTVAINPRDLMSKDAAIHGLALLTLPPEERKKIYHSLGTGLQQETLKPIVGRKYYLGEAAQAHQALMQKGATGKIVLITG